MESGVYNKEEVNIPLIMTKLISENLPEDVGAVMVFIGVAKAVGKNDKRVSRLEIESYEEHANVVIRKICEEVRDKYNVSFVKIYHLIGSFNVGEPLVYVIVASRSRKEAMQALKEAIERYKREATLWKKEIYVDGTFSWVT
ncbi:MAG: molybdenum cofactor biosynthesis protein MoaE [Nitrososphaerota archaeon]|nr:molybdenum cofactor biosynthesis protein MoaE [Nitrososphaerota archaeon]